MTADEWDEWVRVGSPRPLVDHVWPTATVRKRRLFLIALYLRGEYRPTDDWELHVLRVAEKAAHGYISENLLRREAGEAHRRASATGPYSHRRQLAGLIDPALRSPGEGWLHLFTPARPLGPGELRSFNEWGRMSIDLARCVFGDPTRPVRFDPAWKTETVVALARGIDADRAYDRLPVLADALDDAGCDHPQVVAHCRADRTHAPGCWVVDAVLGRV